MLKPLTVWIMTDWKILQEMVILDHLTCLLRILYASQEEAREPVRTVRLAHGDLASLVPHERLLRSSSCLVRKPPRAPQLEETPEMPPSSRGERLLFLPGLESNPESSLQTEEEA